MQAKVIRDANAGNSCHTYYKGFAERMYCVQVGNDYLRNKAGRVRRFETREAAEKAAQISPT